MNEYLSRLDLQFETAWHRNALNNVIKGAYKLAQLRADLASPHRDAYVAKDVREQQEHLQASLRMCRDAISKAVGCSGNDNSVVTSFIRAKEWGQLPEVQALWQEYLAAGLVLVDNPITVDDATDGALERVTLARSTALPLEVAIVCGNVDAVRALLDAGADPTKVPSSPSMQPTGADRVRGALGAGDGVWITDLLSFIAAKAPGGVTETLLALASEALMRRKIDASTPSVMDAPASSTSSRNRTL